MADLEPANAREHIKMSDGYVIADLAAGRMNNAEPDANAFPDAIPAQMAQHKHRKR